MSVRIGEALIQRGLLDRGQLEAALQLQLISGGHLGTYLIELGFIDEDAMARTLGEILGFRSLTRGAFDDIPEEAIGSLSRELVEKYDAVPIGREGRTLHLAVIDPKSLSNLSSETGLKIVPYIVPEIRIIRAMERYYQIPLRRRFVKISCPPIGPAIRQARGARAASGSRSAAGPRPVVHARPPRREDPISGLDGFSRRISRVETRQELARAILDYAGPRMRRAILFDVEGEEARVHDWRGSDLSPNRLKGLILPVTPESIFALVIGEAYFRGTVPRDAPCDSFYRQVGISEPREILILPVYGDERLEIVFYGDGGPNGQIDGEMATYHTLTECIALAMKMLSCKMALRR